MSTLSTESKNLLVICGPTASGKTRLAVDLALEYGGEVISADSMQVYKGMDIGTAKPSSEEMRGVPHHLLGFLDMDEDFSVARYAGLAKDSIADVLSRGRLPILAGGTGLYISAVTDNISYAAMPEDPGLRERLRAEAAELGGEVMLERLGKADPALAGRLHPNNLGRILRALEVYELTGETMSSLQEKSRSLPPEYGLCMIGLSYRDRQRLYDGINRRVDQMLEQGIVREAREVMESGGGTAAQAIGYKELFACIRGEEGIGEAAERLKMETRRYAKRQLTWFRRDIRVNWLYHDDYGSYSGLLAECHKIIRDRFGDINVSGGS